MDKGPPIVEKIIDKLTGMNTQIIYDFNNLEIGLPNAEGPNGKQIARESWQSMVVLKYLQHF